MGRGGFVGRAVAGALVRPVVRRPVHDRRAGEEEGGAGLGGIDPDALLGAVALAEGHHRGHGDEVGAADVHVGESIADGVAVGQAGHEGEAGDRGGGGAVGAIVAVGALEAEAGGLDVDDVGLHLDHLVEGEAPIGERGGGEVVDDGVGDAQELPEDFLALWGRAC